MKSFFQDILIEAGCDEAGRGCLAGPVFAAAVILPKDFTHDTLTDSKKLSSKQRYLLRDEIKEKAIAWAVASCDNHEIDKINILKASVRAMHKAVAQLSVRPEFLIIDGNYFIPYPEIRHRSIVKGDALYYSIAAASVLAKTCRDDYMIKLASEHPQYLWEKNKGYPSQAHRNAIAEHGITSYHRRSFQLKSDQLEIPFEFKG
ncbi:MAG: ribonuclease HII [Bacteroidales bacterium]|jgi:ribonuclease HII|nr:ribonuclease HII [Bacteroidales bacterium]